MKPSFRNNLGKDHEVLAEAFELRIEFTHMLHMARAAPSQAAAHALAELDVLRTRLATTVAARGAAGAPPAPESGPDASQEAGLPKKPRVLIIDTLVAPGGA